ncbi:hypothetical protein, partial [Helicobacter sp.]|uniref:hypothetical protein n=1 Tax=Helicobacter sp. TaxID=218 RepID=UPI0025C02B1E
MNTNNTKFTFNKKSFALSLACVGLLATAGNANFSVTGEGGVSVTGQNGSFHVTSNGAAAGTIKVTGSSGGSSLDFSGGNTELKFSGANSITIEQSGTGASLNDL